MSHLSPPRLIRTLGIAVLLLSGAIGAQTPEEWTVAYTKPGVAPAQYKQFKVLPLNVSDARVIPPPWVEPTELYDWALIEETRELLRSTFAQAVRQGIEAGGQYRVVSEGTPGTLQLEVRLISLRPWASREEGPELRTRGSGTLTFEAYVRDAHTAELLAVYQGTQQVGQDFHDNTLANKKADLARHFAAWGNDISQRLATEQARLP
jgi:hypothetical protein